MMHGLRDGTNDAWIERLACSLHHSVGMLFAQGAVLVCTGRKGLPATRVAGRVQTPCGGAVVVRWHGVWGGGKGARVAGTKKPRTSAGLGGTGGVTWQG